MFFAPNEVEGPAVAFRALRRPYGTLGNDGWARFPTLKRGANLHCASGAGDAFEIRLLWCSTLRKEREGWGTWLITVHCSLITDH